MWRSFSLWTDPVALDHGAHLLREGDVAQGQELKDGEGPPIGAEVYDAPAGAYPDGTTYPAKRYWRKNQKAEFTHWPGESGQVIDDMLANERKSGSF